MLEAIQAAITAFFFLVVLLSVLKILRNQTAELQLMIYIKNQIEHLKRGGRELRKRLDTQADAGSDSDDTPTSPAHHK